MTVWICTHHFRNEWRDFPRAMGPRWPKTAPRRLQDGARGPKKAPRWSRMDPRRPPRWPKTAPRRPQDGARQPVESATNRGEETL